MKFQLGREVAVDLGTAVTRVAVKGRGMVLAEPTVAAVDRKSGQVVRVGAQAAETLARTSGELVAVHPLDKGVVADVTVTQALLQRFLKTALGRLGKPRLVVGMPTGASQVVQRALSEAAMEAGARSVRVVPAPLAAAMGAGVEVHGPEGLLVADMGAGCLDAAVLSLGGVAVRQCVPLGGNALDEALIQYVRTAYRVLLGQSGAREVKETAGTVSPEGGQDSCTVKGRCLDTGLPKEVTLTGEDTARAFAPVADGMIAALRTLLEQTPPELAEDVRKGGILLTGGGANLRGLDGLLADAVGIPVRVAEEPELCVIRGLEASLGG